MAITISGENNIDRILASDGVLDSISGINAAGIVTATSFTGDLTGDVTGNLTGNVTGNVNATSNLLLQIGGSEKFRVASSGQLGIGGANYGTSGQVLTSGGSGSAATWSTISGTTINNNADNRVITGSGTANTLEGEANLTFTGSQLNVTGNIKLPDSSAPDYIGNIYVGDNSDLKIFHNGYDNFIRSGAGNHNIRIDNNAGVLGARFIPAGSSELYHNGSLRAYTAFNGFYAEQAEHNDDFDLLIANKFGSLSDNQRCAITCRVTKDAGGSHGGTNRQAVFGHMYNGSTGGGGYYNIRSNDGTNRDFYMDNNTNLRVNYGSNNIGSSNGTVVGSQSSDIRNKNLVGDGTVSYGLSEVLQLNPIKYQYKKELVDRIGFSAQQVEPIIPESVYDTKQDQDNEGNTVSGDTIKAMYYVDLIPVLVNAIKELKAENDALKKRLDDGGL